MNEERELDLSQRGSIEGVVRDSSRRAPLAFATITAVGTGVGVTTDEHGRYRISGLRAGRVGLRIAPLDLSGAARVQDDSTTVVTGQTTVHDVVMRTSAEGETRSAIDSVEVGAEVPKAKHDLHCALQLVDAEARVGQAPRFVARIEYSGPDSIYLLSVPIGRRWGRHAPRAWTTLVGPSPPSRGHGVMIDDFRSRPELALTEGDFYVLHAGDYIFAAVTDEGDSVVRAGQSYESDGMYRVEFRYDTTDPHPRDWLAWHQLAASPRTLAMLRRVPRVLLEAETGVRVRY